ncbi:MAG: substrate-binding domain-containing protein [Lachnospiraceae bacterium]|nr:substrate-binding domain-containing protein [Lachnospiraceae bacterium]
MKKGGPIRTILKCLLFALLAVLSSIASILTVMFVDISPIVFVFVIAFALLALLYFLLRKLLVPSVIRMNAVITGISALVVTILFVATKGNTEGRLFHDTLPFLYMFIAPGFFLIQLYREGTAVLALMTPLYALHALLLSILFQKRFDIFRKLLPILAACLFLVLSGISLGFYLNRPAKRYAGHGFQYMHGYSSTDFSDYMVYSDPSKLVMLDHPASLTIEYAEAMPKMDGAEACYPVYAAAAKAVYKDIDLIEMQVLRDRTDLSSNGKIVRFTNTINGFNQLIYSDNGTYHVDLFFGARPSKSQLESAKEEGVDLLITPIGKEAFVFFVEPDNPVTNLTSDEIRKIYSGEITNWSEVGGKDQNILAFQRPENSGSQTMMQYFMGDTPLKKPQTYEYVGPMGGVVEQVAQYANERGAFGYSFRYFVEDLMQENNVRVISVDGVKPTLESIKDGSYPLTTVLCLITRKDDPNPNVRKMIDFMLSPDGQEIIEKTGYAGIAE